MYYVFVKLTTFVVDAIRIKNQNKKKIIKSFFPKTSHILCDNYIVMLLLNYIIIVIEKKFQVSKSKTIFFNYNRISNN